MKSSFLAVLLIVNYVVASLITYTTFRGYPDHSAVATVQWLLFYLVTVIYPIGWTALQLRVIRKLGLEETRALRRFAWAPVIVGGTSLLIGLSLLIRLRV